MRYSMWTYAWDILDLSLPRVVGELRDCGLNTIAMASSYHAGRFLQPRSPARKAYFPEDGTIYFHPDPAMWEGHAIQPKLADLIRDNTDVLRALVSARDAGGLGVSCWTVCLHNTRLGQLHPASVTRNAFGDANYYNLCPANDDARRYAITLVADITHHYRPDTVELESPCFMGFAHEFHHEKDAVGLTPEDDFLLSVCFCDACLARATRAGVSGAAARETVRQLIVESCERAIPRPRWPDFMERGLAAFSDYPALAEYLAWRHEPVTSLIGEIKAAAHPDSQILMIDLRDGWLGACDLPAIAVQCDGALLCAYDMDEAQARALMQFGRDALGKDKFLGSGLRLFYPEMSCEGDVVRRTAALAQSGAQAINYYNYGLIPQARMAWIAQAIATANGQLSA